MRQTLWHWSRWLLIIDQHSKADFAMNYYNADGTSGGMCGNGGRCAAAFYIGENKRDTIHFYAHGHIYDAKLTSGGNVQLTMKEPSGYRGNMTFTFHEETLYGHYIDTGLRT